MSSEDDTEDFELSERDLQDAMGNRKYKKRTKHSQIYGIWADEDEDDNGGRPAFGGRGGGAKSKKDYTMPGTFYISITRLPGRYLLDFWPKFLNKSAIENNSSDLILR
jgi:hypothetical protein